MRPHTTSIATSALCACICASTLAGGLVLNEYNAVGSTKFLNAGTATADVTGGFAVDLTFGRVIGNQNNWIELVVTEDHLDIRGWKLRWAESLKFTSNGTDLWYGDSMVNQGIITFSNDSRWSDLRVGTILTVIEFQASGQPQLGFDDDFTFDPCNGDWWMNVHTMANTSLISTVTNVITDAPGNFSVGNDGWMLQVVNSAGQVMTPACGEGALGYAGGGVNSTEVCRLEGDPRQVIDASMHDDADGSSFGRPNSWGDPINLLCKNNQGQYFDAMRAPVLDECSSCVPLFLNEYNAVTSTGYLNGGTAGLDGNGGAAADAFFGRTLGNGGNWFELVTAVDGVDLRGARFEWRERRTGGNTGVITLRSDVASLASLPAGTIITVIERNDGGRQQHQFQGGLHLRQLHHQQRQLGADGQGCERHDNAAIVRRRQPGLLPGRRGQHRRVPSDRRSFGTHHGVQRARRQRRVQHLRHGQHVVGVSRRRRGAHAGFQRRARVRYRVLRRPGWRRRRGPRRRGVRAPRLWPVPGVPERPRWDG